MNHALEHRLVVPEGTDPELAQAILAGRYALPKVPDMPKAHRILDLGAGVGAFCAWSFYLWPHAWIDAYERNEARAAYCKQNAPPGTKVHVEFVGPDTIAGLPRAEVLRVAGDVQLEAMFLHYRHWDAVRVVVHEWHDDATADALERTYGFRRVASGVDRLDRGFVVWMRTSAHYDKPSDVHYVIGDDAWLDDEAALQEPSFALGLTNTPWVPARRESFVRLVAALGCAAVDDALHVHDDVATKALASARIFNEREPNHSWSRKMWAWALETSATHALFLQDDVWPAPNFWKALRAIVQTAPNEIIGLEAAHPAGRALAGFGERWYATRAWLIGPGYVVPRAHLEALLTWRARQPRVRILNTNEDTLVNEFCVETGRRVLHPIPTIIDHDTTIASTYANDDHEHRRPTVKWTDGKKYGFELEDLEKVEFWRASCGVTRLELPETAK